jgi:hypothetical protein
MIVADKSTFDRDITKRRRGCYAITQLFSGSLVNKSRALIQINESRIRVIPVIMHSRRDDVQNSRTCKYGRD